MFPSSHHQNFVMRLQYVRPSGLVESESCLLLCVEACFSSCPSAEQTQMLQTHPSHGLMMVRCGEDEIDRMGRWSFYRGARFLHRDIRLFFASRMHRSLACFTAARDPIFSVAFSNLPIPTSSTNNTINHHHPPPTTQANSPFQGPNPSSSSATAAGCILLRLDHGTAKQGLNQERLHLGARSRSTTPI